MVNEQEVGVERKDNCGGRNSKNSREKLLVVRDKE